MAKSRQINGVVWIVILGVFLCCRGYGQEAGSKRIYHVLLLNSYHIGHRWSDDVTQGIIETLGDESSDSIELSVEYMDTMRLADQDHLEMLAGLYSHKYSQLPIDLIIACDNNALNFVLACREQVFDNLPVVFCGINDFEPEMIAGQKNITGINQYLEVAGTIRMALKVQPGLRKMLVINDETTTGQANQLLFDKARTQFENRLTFEVVRQVNPDILFEKLGSLGPDSAVLLFKYHYDSTGRFYSEPEFVQMIRTHCRRPIYSFQEQFMEFGITGGEVLSGRLHGQAAAKLALRILRGEPADSIPVQMTSPVVEVLDYRQIVDYDLKTDKLSPHCHILNQPPSRFENYRKWIWIAFWIILVQSIYIVILLALRRKQALTQAALQVSEQALRRERDILNRILESSPNGIMLVSHTGRLSFANSQARLLLGISSDPETAIDLNHPDWETIDLEGEPVPRENRAFFQILSSGGRLYNIQHGIRRRDHSTVVVAINAAPLYNESGKIDNIIFIFEDITKQIAAAKEREKLITQLEYKNQEMEQYMYTFSHDLRSPLVSIGGYLGMMQQDIAQGAFDNISRYYQTIITALNQMNCLLDDLLALSRVGRVQSIAESVDLNDLIQEVIALVHGRLFGRQIEYRIQDHLPEVSGDRHRFIEVFQNLIDNAAKYMGNQSQPIIEIGCDVENSHYRFWVRDNGIGILPQYREKIFNLFEKLDRSTDGSGMGLAIVERIVELYGGTIWVESPGAGQGCCFYFTLPRTHSVV